MKRPHPAPRLADSALSPVLPENFLAPPRLSLFLSHESLISAEVVCPAHRLHTPEHGSSSDLETKTPRLKPNTSTEINPKTNTVMKLTSYALLAAAAACGLASAAETAYTTPVGYVTIDVPASSDTTVVPPLERSPLHSAASSSISGNVIGATGLTSGAFVSGAGCYLHVTSGTLTGKRYLITANDATTITVDGGATTLEAQGFVGTRTPPLTGDTYKVVPYWTLNTLFPNGTGVGTTNDVTSPTSFVFAASTGSGINQASAKAYIYCTGDLVNELPAGWYDNDAVFDGPLPEAATRIDLSRMYSIRTASPTAQTVVVSGQVPDSSMIIPVAFNTGFNDVYLGSPYPIDVSLQDSGLQSAISASTDVTAPVELIFVYDDTAAGINKAAAKAYFYCSGDVVNELPAGWYDNDAVFEGPMPSTTKQIKAGRALVIRKAPYVSSGSFSWTAPLPYSL
jgi:uncharacterized protein (TIGR02597 family)